MKSTGAKVRAVAAEIVDAVVNGGRSLDAVIRDNETRLPASERALLRMLCFGTLRQHWRLQSWIAQLVSKPLRKRDSVINSLLAIGLYQLAEMRIPDHAVVSETVQATRTLKRPKMAGLVNACLRRFTRDNLAAREAADVEAQWNHPAWLIDAMRTDWPDDWQNILNANGERAPMWLRVNSSQVSRDDYLLRLREAGLQAEGIEAIPDAIRLHEPQPVAELPGFEDGDVCGIWILLRVSFVSSMRVRPRAVKPGICLKLAAIGCRCWRLTRTSPALQVSMKISTESGAVRPLSAVMHRIHSNGGMESPLIASCWMHLVRRRA
jgi:16S rRNA (cytosine967-C5)-methyltransferase